MTNAAKDIHYRWMHIGPYSGWTKKPNDMKISKHSGILSTMSTGRVGVQSARRVCRPAATTWNCANMRCAACMRCVLFWGPFYFWILNSSHYDWVQCCCDEMSRSLTASFLVWTVHVWFLNNCQNSERNLVSWYLSQHFWWIFKNLS